MEDFLSIMISKYILDPIINILGNQQPLFNVTLHLQNSERN